VYDKIPYRPNPGGFYPANRPPGVWQPPGFEVNPPAFGVNSAAFAVNPLRFKSCTWNLICSTWGFIFDSWGFGEIIPVSLFATMPAKGEGLGAARNRLRKGLQRKARTMTAGRRGMRPKLSPLPPERPVCRVKTAGIESAGNFVVHPDKFIRVSLEKNHYNVFSKPI
jgi:hypothetical protein